MNREQGVPASAPGWPRRTTRPPTSRYTIDLETHHREVLKARAAALGTTASAIVRALLDLVEQDPALAERLAERVRPE